MEKSSFFNAELKGDTYDRTYLAEDYARYFNSFIANGVFPTPSTNLQVVANTNMTVTIKAGRGWINGYYYENTDDLILPIIPADGVLNRLDRVVLRLDFLNREIKAYVKKGVFASVPVIPTLVRNADMYELGIADIAVNRGAIKITQVDITDLRQNNNFCGLVVGTVKQIDTTNLFAQYQAGFEQWFKNVKDQLGESVAGNLQNQLNINSSQLGEKVNKIGDLGDIKQFAITPTSNWKNCDGTSLVKTEYTELYSFLGSKTETPVVRDFISRAIGLPIYEYANKIVFGNGIYVASCDKGRILTSTDGITWTVRQTVVNTKLESIAFGNGIFVTHSEGGVPRKSLISTNGITWTATDETVFGAGGAYLPSIIFDGTQFVALTNDSSSTKVFASPDGVNWILKFSLPALYYNLTFGNGVYAFINRYFASQNMAVWTSTNLTTWTQTLSMLSTSAYGTFNFVNGLFVITGGNTNVYTSSNGTNFSKITINGLSTSSGLVFLDVGDKTLVFYIGKVYTIPILSSNITLTDTGIAISIDSLIFNNGLIIGTYASAPQVIKTSLYYDPLKFSLPLIPNSYVKAKEV